MEARPDLFGERDREGLDLAGRLAAWAAEARADAGAAARAHEGFLRRRAGEDATIAGVLVDLAERGEAVVVTTVAGRRLAGWLRAVGPDIVVVRTDVGRDHLLAVGGLTAVRSDSDRPPSTGDRDLDAATAVATPVVIGLAEALALLAEDRPRVLVVPAAGDGLAGELRSVGRDVVTIALDGPKTAVAYVAIAAITEVAVA